MDDDDFYRPERGLAFGILFGVAGWALIGVVLWLVYK